MLTPIFEAPTREEDNSNSQEEPTSMYDSPVADLDPLTFLPEVDGAAFLVPRGRRNVITSTNVVSTLHADDLSILASYSPSESSSSSSDSPSWRKKASAVVSTAAKDQWRSHMMNSEIGEDISVKRGSENTDRSSVGMPSIGNSSTTPARLAIGPSEPASVWN